MNRYIILAAAALQTLAMHGQNTSFQIFTTSDAVMGPNTVKILSADAMFGPPVTGKPFSGVEVRHSVQVLGDGTRIETKSTDKIFRDDQGRTRVEREDGTVLISDAVTGSSAEISPGGHVSRRGSFNYTSTGKSATLTASSATDADMKKKFKAELDAQAGKIVDAQINGPIMKKMAVAGEDLGYQSVNGVTAKGTRNTNTIEAGRIGNDRPITVVSERWYSQDLEMLVKSTNSDPRFGETSYELTNILQVPPDPGLFQIPAASHD